MIHLTPQLMAAQYDALLLTPPFDKWGMPAADEVGFHATVPQDGAQGEYWFNGGHHIRVNPKRHASLRSLTETLAHEMIHLRIKLLGKRYQPHGPLFNKLKGMVCKRHSFDLGQF